MEVIKKPKAGVNQQMTLKILRDFSEDDNLNVLVVKGSWGVGKTYSVKAGLKSLKRNYYYVSAFGVSSTEQLKRELLAGLNDEGAKGFAKITSRPFRWLGQLLSWISGKSDQVSKIPTLPGTFISGGLITLSEKFFSELSFKALKNSIICIDDLERKRSDFRIDELLGFVDYLVEQLQVKVVLIYNEDELCQDDIAKKYLDQYREKIIDVELLFNPTIDENIEICFGNNSVVSIIKEIAILTGVGNIRVMRKALWLIGKLQGLMQGSSEDLIRQVVINAFVITLAKLNKDFPVNVDFLKNSQSNSYFSGMDSDELSDSLRKNNFLARIGYADATINQCIFDLLESGIISDEEFRVNRDALEVDLKYQAIVKQFRELWQPYHSSFCNNSVEIAKNINHFLEQNLTYLSLQDLASLENLAAAVDLDISMYKVQLFKYLLAKANSVSDLRTIKEYVSAPGLISELEGKLAIMYNQMTITDVLMKISGRNGWSEEDVNFLSSQNIDAYSLWLDNGYEDLVELIRFCLNMQIEASVTLEKAIRKAAHRNKLNEMQAKMLFKITIDE
jgi:hypothetical protein